MSGSSPNLLSLPQELRDHIYSYLFLPATATTEHPFPQCTLSGRRFKDYYNICLVNSTIYLDAKAYFTKHIAPKTTFYFTSVAHLQHFQYLAHTHCPVLKLSTFHIRCGNGTNSVTHPAMVASTSRNYQTRAQCEEVEALIRIQPGFKWWMDELPGFYRSRPATLTNYGYFPATGPTAWKPAKHGVAVFEQTGGELCDSRTCAQKALGQGREVEVTEVHFPPLDSGLDLHSAPVEPALAGKKGRLDLSCYMWLAAPANPMLRTKREASIMVLQGKFRDVCIPENVVEMELKKRAERMQ